MSRFAPPIFRITHADVTALQPVLDELEAIAARSSRLKEKAAAKLRDRVIEVAASLPGNLRIKAWRASPEDAPVREVSTRLEFTAVFLRRLAALRALEQSLLLTHGGGSTP